MLVTHYISITGHNHHLVLMEFFQFMIDISREIIIITFMLFCFVKIYNVQKIFPCKSVNVLCTNILIGTLYLLQITLNIVEAALTESGGLNT